MVVVPVLAKPRVAFIPTGDELQIPGSAFVAHGKNLETNSIMVKMKLEAWGGEFVPLQIVPDAPPPSRQPFVRRPQRPTLWR